MTSLAQRLAFAGEPSYLSSPNSTAVQFLIHARVVKSGAIACVRVLADPDGVQDVEADESSRSRVRDEFERVRRDFKMRVVPAPEPYVAWRIHAAVAAHEAAGKTLSPAWQRALATVPRPDGLVAHPTKALSPVPDAEARVERSLALHTEPEINALLPSKREIEAVGHHVAQRDREPAVALGALADPTLIALREAISLACTSESLDRLATQLRDVALVFAATRRPELALDAVATADAIDAAGEGGTAPDKIPYVFGLFYKFALVQREYAKAQAK